MRQRFALIDRQIAGLQSDIAGYTAHVEPVPKPVQAPATEPRPAAAPPAPMVPSHVAVPREPSWLDVQLSDAGAAMRRYRGELNLSDFLGLRALAWAGGVITLL